MTANLKYALKVAITLLWSYFLLNLSLWQPFRDIISRSDYLLLGWVFFIFINIVGLTIWINWEVFEYAYKRIRGFFR